MSAVETFELLVRHQTARELVPFLLGLDKKDVAAVRQRVRPLQQQLAAEYIAQSPGPWSWQPIPDSQRLMLFLAGLATFTRKEALSRTADSVLWEFYEPLTERNRTARMLSLEVLAAVRPPWLLEFLQQATLPYSLLRALEERQLLAYEPALVAQSVAQRLKELSAPWNQKGDFPDHVGELIVDELRADKLLLQRDLLLLFDFDTPADGFNRLVKHYPKRRASADSEDDKAAYATWQEAYANWAQANAPLNVDFTWHDALLALAASGHLDRADLLSRSLLALRRDFRRPLLIWFKNLFLALKPTLAERLARQADLVELLTHALPLVVNFALDQLKDLWANPGFDPAPLLRAAEGLLTRADLKTGLRTLLGGLEKLWQRDPALAPSLARLAASALPHPDRAVQERAAQLLARVLGAQPPLLSPAEAADITATVAGYADLLSAATGKILAPFLAQPAAPPAAAPVAARYEPLAAFIPDLSPATAIVPVADWHELLFLTGQVLKYDDPAALEGWLDGLLRLRGQFPPDYAQQLRPYIRQAFPWAPSDKTEAETHDILLRHRFGQHDVGQRELIQALLLSWYTAFAQQQVSQVSLADYSYSKPDPLLRVEQRRLATAEALLRQPPTEAALPLLSTPSHTPHWVAPSVLVQKLLTYQAAARTPNAADLALALARTAFSLAAEAATARQQLPQLQDTGLRELLHWFLAPASSAPGEAIAPEWLQRPDPAAESTSLAASLRWLWAVAARTRYPTAPLEALQPLADYPGLVTPWHPGWRVEHQQLRLALNSENQLSPPPSPLLVYSLHAQLGPESQYYTLQSLGPDLPFLLTLLPNNPAPLHWHVLRTACRTDDAGGAQAREVMQVSLTSLLPPGPPFDEPATVLLAVGLLHHAPTCRALAREVVLAAVEAGRLVPVDLGSALGKLLAGEYAPVARLSEALTQLRAVSPLTDDALRQTIEALLPTLPEAPPRNTAKLLEAYADLLGRAPQPLPELVRARLGQWTAIPSLKKPAVTLLA